MGVTIPGPSGEVKESYEISNSLRFNDGDSPQLNLANEGTVTNNKIFTYSVWIKKSSIESANQSIISAESGNNRAQLLFRSSSNDAIRIVETSDAYSSFNTLLTTASLFRDPSAWYHIVLSYDSTDGTAGDRVKIYVNSVLQTLSGTTADSNFTTPFNEESYNLDIGHLNNSEFLDGHMSDAHFIDGQALTPTSFGETNDNGVWIPKRYTGSYGLNGFKLELKQTGTSTNSSGIGADTSGNDRHFAVSNLAAHDITEDTPTNNFATLNSLFRSNFDNDGEFREGSSQIAFTSGDSDRGYGFSTFGVTSGKWYWEVKITTVARANTGIGDATAIAAFTGPLYDESTSKGFIVNYAGGIEENGTSTSYANSLSDNDIVMWALDMDNHRAYYGINGTWQDSGDPTSGSTGTGDVTTQISDQSHLNTGEPMFPFCLDASTSGQSNFKWNFGNPPFTISSGNNDGKYGNFEYAPPSGYYALCTKRLAEFG